MPQRLTERARQVGVLAQGKLAARRCSAALQHGSIGAEHLRLAPVPGDR